MHLVKIEGQTHSTPKGQPRGHRNHHCEQTLLLEGGGVRVPSIITHKISSPQVRISGCPTSGAMMQRILGSHTPPCHRRMVITTISAVFCCTAAHPYQVQLVSRIHCAQFSSAYKTQQPAGGGGVLITVTVAINIGGGGYPGGVPLRKSACWPASLVPVWCITCA